MPSNTSSNKAVVPEAKGALDRFKFEVANELGVPIISEEQFIKMVEEQK